MSHAQKEVHRLQELWTLTAEERMTLSYQSDFLHSLQVKEEDILSDLRALTPVFSQLGFDEARSLWYRQQNFHKDMSKRLWKWDLFFDAITVQGGDDITEILISAALRLLWRLTFGAVIAFIDFAIRLPFYIREYDLYTIGNAVVVTTSPTDTPSEQQTNRDPYTEAEEAFRKSQSDPSQPYQKHSSSYDPPSEQPTNEPTNQQSDQQADQQRQQQGEPNNPEYHTVTARSGPQQQQQQQSSLGQYNLTPTSSSKLTSIAFYMVALMGGFGGTILTVAVTWAPMIILSYCCFGLRPRQRYYGQE